MVAVQSVLMSYQLLHSFLVFLSDKQINDQSSGSKGLSS